MIITVACPEAMICTAYIATIVALEAMPDDLAHQFTVPLSASGNEPHTHLGMNWDGIPEDTSADLSARDGVACGPDFAALCADLGLVRVEPDGAL